VSRRAMTAVSPAETLAVVASIRVEEVKRVMSGSCQCVVR
jgi:hypothetical protein